MVIAKLNSVSELFERAGPNRKEGTRAIADHPEINLHQCTVQRWEKIGVPQRYWNVLIKWLKITTDDLHRITERAKADFKKLVKLKA